MDHEAGRVDAKQPKRRRRGQTNSVAGREAAVNRKGQATVCLD